MDQSDQDTPLIKPGQNQDPATQERIMKIEQFADSLISTSSDDLTCEIHKTCQKNNEEIELCEICHRLKEKAEKYQSHYHTFTCEKKKKIMSIKPDEGHGRLNGQIKGSELSNISVCRFRFPRFPLDETKLILGISKDANPNLIKERRSDLSKITKYLIRQTHTEKPYTESESCKKLKRLHFWKFLYEVGMFNNMKLFKE